MKPVMLGSLFADRYEIVALIGDGGMGQVYRAVQLPLCKEVALKLVKATVGPGFEARFEREAHVIAKLDHANCIRVLDFGRADDRQFIAMELLEGPTLAETLLLEGPFAIARALSITRNLLAGLAHAHGHGVLHRDIKPENVMLVTRGAVIIDFGLAVLSDESAVTQAGMCIGSPSYLAPERLLGRPCDARADLYAVGVILYEMLGGIRPFIGSSPRDIMERALARPPRPLRVVRAEVPPALEAIVSRALAKDPARRFESAAEMLAAIDDLRATPEADDAAASTMIQLALTRPTRWQRLCGWLRYGTWRWRRAS